MAISLNLHFLLRETRLALQWPSRPGLQPVTIQLEGPTSPCQDPNFLANRGKDPRAVRQQQDGQVKSNLPGGLLSQCLR